MKIHLLMPTRAILGGLTVADKRLKRGFADVTELHGPYNSQLVVRLSQRFESVHSLSILRLGIVADYKILDLHLAAGGVRGLVQPSAP